jgi:hypothetical protein
MDEEFYHQPISIQNFLRELKKYQTQFGSSTKFFRFFELLAILFEKLSTKQQDSFQYFFGCLDEGFFKKGDFLGLFKTVLNLLYATDQFSLQLSFGNHQQEHIDTAMEVLELGQFFVELFFPRNISEFQYINRLKDAGILDNIIVDLLVHQKTFLNCKKVFAVEVEFKEFFRDGCETKCFCDELLKLITSDPIICKFLWNHCDICGKEIQIKAVNDKIRACTDCRGTCVLLPELAPAPRQTLPAHAQASVFVQALITEITNATISFGEPAQDIACVLLENGVSKLSELLVLKQREFESLLELLIEKFQLNVIQVRKIREASGRP